MENSASILIVEDDVIIAMRLQDTLETWGYKTQTCQSGTKAIEIAQHTLLDLALMDINLSGSVDGIATAEALRKMGCPSVFLTAYSDDELLERAKSAEPYGYLVKPVYDRELRSTIEMALVKQRSDRQQRESERRFRLIFEHAGVGLSLVNTKTDKLLMANARHWEILGIPEKEYAADEIFRTFTHPDDIPRQVELLTQLKRGDLREFSLEKRYLTPTRGTVWVRLTVSALGEDGQPPDMLVMIMDDITERKQADETLQMRVAELEAMNRISSALRSADRLDAALPMLLNELLKMVKAEAGVVAIYSTEHPGVDGLATCGWFKDFTEIFQAPGCLATMAMVERSGVEIVDFVDDLRLTESCRARLPSGWSGVILPIVALDQALGVAIVATEQPRRLAPAETRLLETVTAMAALAIQRIRLFEGQARSLKRIASLHQIDDVIRSDFDMAATLEIILEHVCGHLSADAAAVLLVDEDEACLKLVASKGLKESSAGLDCIPIGIGLAGKAALERQRMDGGMDNFAAEPPGRRMAFAREGVRHYHCAPLISNDQVTGVLEVYYTASSPPLPDRLDFLNVLAGQTAVAVAARRMIASLRATNKDLNRAYYETIEGWSRAMDLRDKETEGHTRRVTELSVELARRMGFGDEQIANLRQGALLHDIGKIGVPDHILLKPGALTEDEWAVMRTHPRWAYDLISPIEHLRQAVEIPYCHHERWDGSGYPRGLVSEEIPLAARLFAVVDVYDALTSDRPYRPAWSLEKTLNYLHENAGKLFDPQAVDAFLEMVELPAKNVDRNELNS